MNELNKWKLLTLFFLFVFMPMNFWLGRASVVTAEEANPLTQCQAMVGILADERARAQANWANQAALIEKLGQEKRALEEKVKELEEKK